MKNKPCIMAASVPVDEYVTGMPAVNPEALGSLLEDNAGGRPDLILLPQYVIGDISSDTGRKILDALCRFSIKNNCYIVCNYLKEDKKGKYCISRIISRSGETAGEYCKTHKIEGMDPDISLGDDLPVFELDFGRVALLAGTDVYFPEPAEIYSLKGAEMLLCSMGVEPLRDDSQIQKLMRARAIEDYFYVAASTYASTKKMYMTNNYPLFHNPSEEAYAGVNSPGSFNSNGLGLMTGRAVIYDLRGEILASTGRESGFAVCNMDMDRKRKVRDYIYGTGRLLYHQNERGVFNGITESYDYTKKEYPVKKPVISLVHMSYKDSIGLPCLGGLESQGVNYEKLFERIRQAAASSDMVICSELSAPGNRLDNALLERYAACAKEYGCYLLINQEISNINTSLIFDRSGKIVLRYEKVNTLNMMYENKLPAGTELPVAELDFGAVGVMVCADSYCQEIPRLLALKGAEIIILQSQSWGYDAAAINEGVSRSWAVENCAYVIMSNFPSSQVAHRSNIIDPTGETVFASDYNRDGVYSARLDLDAVGGKCGYVFRDNGVAEAFDFRTRVYKARRPELYTKLSNR